MSERRRSSEESSDQRVLRAWLAHSHACRLALLSEDLLRRPSSPKVKRDMLECMRDVERLLKAHRTDAPGANVIDLARRQRLRAISALLSGSTPRPPPRAA